MRVGVVCGDYRPERDGVAHYVQRLTAELQARGVETAVVSAGLWDLAGVRRTAARLRRFDVAHVQFAPSAYAWHGEVGLLPALLRGPKLVTTVHEYDWWSWGPPPLGALLERTGRWDRETGLLVPRSRAVVATNAAHAAAVRRRVPSAPVSEIPIGANLRPLPIDRGRARAALGLRPGQPLLAFFGFVHSVKGIRHLLEATELLRRARPDLRLVLVGGFESLALRGREAAEYRAEVETMIRDRDLRDAVTITGWQSEIAVGRHLAAADVAVLPFTAGTTTKSGSLLTCAGYGLPLVVTAATPPDPELIDGETALLVPPRDGEGILKAVERVLEDADLVAALRFASRRLAAAHSWDRIADAHLRLYERVLA